MSRLALPLLLCVALAIAMVPAEAQVGNDAAPLEFRDAAEEARFQSLAAELRCVMCQNQSLADSNALIALSLRREVLDLMRQGRSDAQVKQHLVERYGEFVLYRPKLAGHTWLLWGGPLLLLLAGGGVVASVVRRRGLRPVPTDEGQEW